MFWLKCSWNMGCWSPGVWATEGSLTFVLIGGISGSRGRLLIKWSAGYLSIQMNRSAATIFCTVTIFCVVTVFEISSLWLPLQCSTMGQQKTLQKQQEEHLKNASSTISFLSIGLSQHWILQDFYFCWTRSRTHIMGHVYWWNSGLSSSYGLLTSPKVCFHFIICLSGLHMSEGCFLWKEVRVLLLFSGGASQIPS